MEDPEIHNEPYVIKEMNQIRTLEQIFHQNSEQTDGEQNNADGINKYSASKHPGNFVIINPVTGAFLYFSFITISPC